MSMVLSPDKKAAEAAKKAEAAAASAAKAQRTRTKYQEAKMPKMKTSKTAAKRFKKTEQESFAASRPCVSTCSKRSQQLALVDLMAT